MSLTSIELNQDNMDKEEDSSSKIDRHMISCLKLSCRIFILFLSKVEVTEQFKKAL